MDEQRRPNLEDLSRYVDGLISNEEQQWIANHLDRDAALRADYELLESLQAVMMESEPTLDQHTFTESRAAILDRIRQEKIAPSASSWPWWARLLSPQRLLPAAALACALVFALTTYFSPGPQRSTPAKTDIVAVADPTPTPQTHAPRIETRDTATEMSPVEKMAQIEALRQWVTTDGKSLWNTGSRKAAQLKESIATQSQEVREPLAEWTVTQTKINAGTTLLCLALSLG